MIEQQVANPNAVRYILAMLLGMVLSLGTVTVQAQGCVPQEDDNPLCNPNAEVSDTDSDAGRKEAIDANTMAITDGDAANKTAIDANTMAITDGDAANKTAIDANTMAITDGDAANKTAIDANTMAITDGDAAK